MTELTVEQRLDRLEKYAQLACQRCEKIITLNETHFAPHYGYLYDDKHPSREMALCEDCYGNYLTLWGDKERDTRSTLGDYMKEIKRTKYNLPY